jgi:hypothetical protein
MFPQPYPDFNPTPTVSKSFTFSDTITAVTTQGYLIWFRPYAAGHRVRLYRAANIGGYYYEREIPLDMSVSEFYDFARTTAAIMRIQSATVSAGNFDVAGVANAVTTFMPPALHTVNFQDLAALRLNEGGLGLNIPVQNGLVSIPPPCPEHEFRIPYDVQRVGVNMESGHRMVNVVTQGGVIPFTALTHQCNAINSIGSYTFHCTFVVSGPVAASTYFELRRNYRSLDALGVVVENFEIVRTYGAPVSPTPYNVDITMSGFAEQETTQFYVFFSQAPGTVVTVNAGAFDFAASIWWDYSSVENNPSVLMAWKGIDVGSQMAVAGVVAMELLPNSSLIKNLKPKPSMPLSTMDIDRFHTLMIGADELGLRTIYTVDEYANFVQKILPGLLGAAEASEATEQDRVGSASSMNFMGILRRVMQRVPTALRGATQALLDEHKTRTGRIGQASSEPDLKSMYESMQRMQAQLEALMTRNEALAQENAMLKQTQLAVATKTRPAADGVPFSKAKARSDSEAATNHKFLDPTNNQERMLNYRQGNLWGNYLTSCVKFPIVDTDHAYDSIGEVVVSSEKILHLDGTPSIYVRDKFVSVDSAFNPSKDTLAALDAVLQLYGIREVFVTLQALHHDAIVGDSWVGAAMAALLGAQPNCAITGGIQKVTNLETKYEICKHHGLEMLVYDTTVSNSFATKGPYQFVTLDGLILAVFRYPGPAAEFTTKVKQEREVLNKRPQKTVVTDPRLPVFVYQPAGNYPAFSIAEDDLTTYFDVAYQRLKDQNSKVLAGVPDPKGKRDEISARLLKETGGSRLRGFLTGFLQAARINTPLKGDTITLRPSPKPPTSKPIMTLSPDEVPIGDL